jgi:hypothetical protein
VTVLQTVQAFSDGRDVRGRAHDLILLSDGSIAVALSNGAIVFIDACDVPILNQWRLSVPAKSVFASVMGRSASVKIQLSRLLTNPFQAQVVDHINGDPLDNRRSNLRVCTPLENARNIRLSRASATGFKGVSELKWGKFRAYAMREGKQYHLGVHDTAVGAAHAYDAFARQHFGRFACLNFPRSGEQSVHRRKSSK